MNKKGVIKISAGIFVLALLLILIFSSIFSSASEDNSYVVGEEVRIDLSKYTPCSLKIKTPFFEEIQIDCIDKFSYVFEEAGYYTFDIKSQDAFERFEFTVYPSNELPKNINETQESPNEENILTETISNQEAPQDSEKEFIQGNAEIGKPVGWSKSINLTEDGNFIEIPNISDFTLKKEDEESYSNYDLVDIDGKKYILINEYDSELLGLEYITEPPILEEKLFYEDRKEVLVSSPENLHYQNVLAYTSIPEKLISGQENLIRVYWKESNTYLNFNAYDKNGNGLLDYVEWIVPHLSNQTFDIILIAKAEHLSSDRTFISNIYEEVKEFDDIWSETINSEEYVRVTFEVPLDNTRDITLYPRIISGNPIIEVYEIDGTEKIAEFSPLITNEYNKIILTNLNNFQDTFDLRIIGGSVEFDHIIDPQVTYNVNSTMDSVWGQPTSSSRWEAGTNSSSSQYANMATINNVYASIAPAGQNDYPFYRFNFTINQDVSLISSIFIRFTGYDGASETGTVYVWRFANSTWMPIGTTPASNGNITRNITSDIASYIDSNNHIVISVEGAAYDTSPSVDYIYIDYVGITIQYLPDSTPPTYNSMSINSTVAGQIAKFAINVTDNIQLDSGGSYIFSTNNTGSWINDSVVLFTTTPSWANVTKILNPTLGTRVGYRWFFNDSAGNRNSTAIYSLLTGDGTPPYFTTIPANASLFYLNQSLLVKFTGTDAIGFGYYRINDTRFLINQTGFLSNATPMSAGNYEINVTINDTSNNINWTRYKVQVNKSQEKCQVFFNTTSPIDYPGTFLVWANCTTPFVLARNGTTIINYSEQALSWGTYNFSLRRNDTVNYTYIYNQSFFTIDSGFVPINSYNVNLTMDSVWGQPVSSSRWDAGTNLTASQYANISTLNGEYARLYSAGQNDYPFYRFNFTIGEALPLITSLYIRFTGYQDTNGETGTVYVWRFANSTWMPIGETPTSNGDVAINLTSDIGSYFDNNKRVVISVEGEGFDTTSSVDYIYIDYVGITIQSAPDTTSPTYSQFSVNNTFPGEITLFAINVTDNFELNPNGQYVFSTNNTGSWVNDTPINFTTTPSWANVTKILRNNSNIRVGYRWYFNDSAGNRNSTPIYTLLTESLPPIANQIQCEQGGSWRSCNQVDFGEILTRVRINCTEGVIDAGFNLTNIPDSYTFFSENSTSIASGFYIYDNPDLTINDSGMFNLSAVCYGVSSQSKNSTAWNVSWGSLNVDLISPSSNTNVNPNQFFNFTTRVTCTGGECGNVNVTLDPAANWWNETWLYRAPINISGTGTLLTDFQIEVTKNLTDLYLKGKIKSDCSDLRFANISSNEISYWIENCDITGGNSTIWVKVPSIAASGNTLIYMYYGNPSASSNSNGTLTFDYFDSGNDIGTWTVVNTAGQTAAQGLPQPSYYATSTSGSYMYKNIGLTTNRIIEYNSRSDGLGNLFFLTNSAGNGQHMRLETRDTYPDGTGIASASAWNSWSAPFSYEDLEINTWYNFSLVIGSTTVQAYINDTICGSPYTFSNNGGYIGLVGDGLGPGFNTWWDNFRVRKYASTTPSYSFNFEEYGYKGIIPMGSGIPFYTISQNPRDHINSTCLTDMKAGIPCDITWQVNATGEIGSVWEFFVFANNTNYLTYVNTGDFSPHINITIGNLPPSVPELNFPSNASALSSIAEFNWSNSIDPTGDSVYYIFEISNSSDFSYIFYRNGSIAQQEEPTGDTPTGITQEGSYYWRVLATDLIANSSWSETRIFYYDLSDPIVRLVFPENLSTNTFSNNLEFIFNVSDLSNIQDCSLIINNSINGTTTNITKNTNLTFTTFLPNSFYSWKVNCTDSAGRVGDSGTNFLTVFVSNNPPVANEIECEKNSVWINCSSIGFGDDFTRLRVRCTDIENGIINATFNLTNTPDGYTYIYGNSTSNLGNYWILDDLESVIDDSGEFNLTATCFDDEGSSSSNSTVWTVPWGRFSLSLINPSSNSYEMRYQFFNFTTRVSCLTGECGNANVTLDPANWWDSSWEKRREINITNGGASTLNDFPVYINVTKQTEMNSNFSDIRFLNGSCDSASLSQLAYEIENYTSSNANVWVKIPSLLSGVNKICIYYGNPSAPSAQNKTGVWTNNYEMVLHISETGTGTRYDSSLNVNNGTPTGYTGSEHIIGKIDGADDLSANNRYINTNYLQSVTNYTISTWVRTSNSQGVILNDRGSGAGLSLTLAIDPSCGALGSHCSGASAGIPSFGVDSDGVWRGRNGASRVDDGNWHYVVGVFNSVSGQTITASNFQVYIDGQLSSGSLADQAGTPTSPLTGLSGTRIGYHQSWNYYYLGAIDELTLSTESRSSDWINMSYQMVENQEDYINFGSAETRSKGIISMIPGATPFYTITQNPLNSSTTSCLAGMKSSIGTPCDLTWQVNATGALDSVWEFFVSAHNLNYLNYFNTSNYSSSIYITIANQLAPSIPQLYLPLNASAHSSIPNLNWTNSTDINGDKIYYILEVSNMSNFSTIIFANYSIPETSNPTGKIPTGITQEGAYYWRVRSTDLIANSSWSETRVFYYDLSAPNLTFINQTGEDNRIINSTNWLNRGENITFFINISDINLDKVWIVVWNTVIGGVENVKTFFTYVGGFLWMAKVSTDQVWGGIYNYTIYTNDTLGSQVNYSSNFTVLGGNSTIYLDPYSTDSIRNITVYGHINLTNTTNLVNYPINLWVDGKLLFLSNLTGEGTYNFYKEFQETSNVEFSQGTFYNTEVQGNQNLTLSSGETFGNFTKILDAGAMVSWNNILWNFEGASCSGVFSYQDGDSNSFSGTSDTYINSGAATTNYGTSSDIVIDGSPDYERGLIKFNQIIGRAFYQIPENSTINNANLTIYVSDIGNLVNVYKILENWTENQATYNQRLTGTSWSSTGCASSPSRDNTEDDSFTASSVGAYNLNVTNSMKSWVSGGFENYGWVFDMSTSNGINIQSSEYSTQSERPLLMVDYQAEECTNIMVYIRTSNDKITWTSWKQVLNGGIINDTNIYSRYLQYRVELTSVNPTITPVLKDLNVNYTAVTTDSNGDYRYNFTNPSQFGNHNIVVNTSLKTILMNNSAILSVQTGMAPNVSLISPQNNQWFSYGNLNLTYNTTDPNNDFAFSELIINGVVNQTNTTPITNYAYNNFSINFSSGQYNWTVNVTDSTAYRATSSPRTFYIDLINPNISLIYPGNQSNFTINQLNLSFNATDNMDNNLTCSVIMDGNTIRLGMGVPNGNITNVSSGVLGSGIHYWNVTCTDNTMRNFTSQTFNFNISDTPPNVTLISPNINYFDNDGNISFTYNVTDNTGFTNCSLIINNTFRTWNQSAILNNEVNVFVINNLFEGNYNWAVECFDLSSNSNKPSSRNFAVDLYKPIIGLIAPSDTGTSISSKVYFNFTVNDTFDSLLNCNMTINGVVVDTFNASSGNLTTRQISNLTDGLKYWNVTCIDDTINSNTSATWTVNITEFPSISLITLNNSKFNQTSINLAYVPSDNTNLSSCRLYLNSIFNQSNSTAVLNGETNIFTVNSIPEGIYNWTVNCSDYFGLTNQSQSRIFYADRSPPRINISYPIGEDIFAPNITFNFTVIDNVEFNLSCNLTVNSSVVASNFTVENGSITSKTIPGITDGYHIWNLTCWDGAGNSNTSSTYNFTRYTNPIVTLNYPDNNTWFNNGSFYLIYTPQDDERIVSASLFINGAFNRTNSSQIINLGYNNFSIAGFSDGSYYWNVNVTDPTGLTGIDSERRFYVDSTPPSLILNYPNESSIITSNNVTFNFSISDNLAQFISCNFTLDDELESSGVYSNNFEVVKYSTIGDGNHTWKIDCVDNASNFNHSDIINFTVKAPPIVTLNLPANDFRTTSSSILFNYTPFDLIGITNCSIYLDGKFNNSNTSISKNTLNNLTIIGISEGMHNWTVNCSDSDYNWNWSPERIFYRDLSPPSIILNSPNNNSGIDFNLDRVYFNWTAIDVLDNTLQCNLTVDGIVREPNVWTTNSSPIRKYVFTSVLGQGEHSWNVTCWDQLKNTNTSELRKFNLSYPDFFINPSEIFFNETIPKENQSVEITATIHNLAPANISNVTVRFYNGDPDSGGIKIGTDIFINLSELSQTNVTRNWFAQLGSSEIFVVIDPPTLTNGSYIELNESNNKASRSINVGSWHFFYGDVLTLSNFVLADSSESSLINWSAGSFSSGNVYVTDYDSYVSWTSLQALGKTSSGSDSSSDFSELDSILNSTTYEDSIYSVYTTGGVIDYKLNLYSFNDFIYEVPTTNSTNNSNFVTGILWDISDDSVDGEFDSGDREDVIFVAPINKNAEGTYGFYDYEIRVPAKLREYNPADSKAAVFYVEIL